MDEPAYSYATHLNIKFDPLKLIDVSSLAWISTERESADAESVRGFI
jgi:hypothetical protein